MLRRQVRADGTQPTVMGLRTGDDMLDIRLALVGEPAARIYGP